VKPHFTISAIIAPVFYLSLGCACFAEDCSSGDALSCYSQALVKLQSARDEFVNATKDLDALRKDIVELHKKVDGLENENKVLKAALAAAVDRLDSIKINVISKTFTVPPASPSGGVIDCPDPGNGLRTVALASGIYLNEPDERNASFVRWYTWPKSTTEFGYYMINGAGTGMGHPPGNFAAYIGCLILK
jgi:hypothetical protein